MPSVTFGSTLDLLVFRLFSGGGAANEGSTSNGLVSFFLGDDETWFVFDSGGLAAADITTLAADLDTYAAPAVHIGKANLTGADLAPLAATPHLDRLVLGGAWTGADLAGLSTVQQLGDLGLSGTAVDDGGLPSLDACTALETLDLSRTPVTGTGLGGLSGLSQLRDLVLLESAFDDDGCASLGNLPSVRHLDLLGTRVTDLGVQSISASLPGLLFLSLDRNAGVTDASVPHLQSLHHLRELAIDQTGISNSGVTTLLSLPELIRLDTRGLAIDDATCQTVTASRDIWQVLAFENTAMTDAALSGFPALQDLTLLALRCGGVTSAGIAHLGACAGLVDLDLEGCSLDDSALTHLYPLANLEVLNVSNTGGAITQGGVDQLVAQIPGLEVIW